MALKNRESNTVYLRLKEGKFWTGGKDTTPEGFEQVEGQITKIFYKDEEYEGNPLRKLALVMEDAGERYQLALNVETAAYSSLVSFLKNVDLTRPLTLVAKENPILKDGKETGKRTSILVQQAGKFAKAYFTKDDPHGLPKWEQVKVGRNIVTDKTNYLEFLEGFVNKYLAPQMDELNGENDAPKEKGDSLSKAPVEDDDAGFPWNED